MKHMIAVELRRSNAKVLAVLLVLGSLGTLAVDQDWTQQWLQLSHYLMSNLFLQVPLALAAGAMLGRRERRTGAAELLGSTGRPRWQLVTPTTAALALTVVAVQLLTLAVGAATIGAAGGFLSLSGAVPVLADLPILIGAAWLGLAAGRAWSSPVLPPVLAALALAGQLGADLSTDPLGKPSRMSNLLLLPQPPNAYWEVVGSQAVLGRLALGLGLAAGGLLLLAGTRRLSRATGIATLVAGIVLLAFITPLAGTNKYYEVDAGAQELVCADGAPQVCVTAVNAYRLDDVTVAARQALTQLAKLPGAPARAVEWRPDEPGKGDSSQFWGTKPTTDPGTVQFALDGYGALTPADVTASLLNGAGTAWNGCKPGDEVATGAAGAWLMGTDTLPLRDAGYGYSAETDAEIKATVTALRKLPEKEQVRRVTALRDAANECRTDDLLAVLTGRPTP